MEKKEIKMSLGTFVVSIIAVILLVVVVGMGVYIAKQNNKEDVKQDEMQNEQVCVNTTETVSQSTNNTVELDVNSELVQKLYGYLGITSDYYSLSMYRDEKKTNSNIENKTKLLTSLRNLKPEKMEKIEEPIIASSEAEYNYNESESYYPADLVGIIDKKTVEDKVKNIFGPNATIKHEDTSFAFGEKIAYKDGKYMIIPYEGGGMVQWYDKSEIIKAEKENDEIYIYDYYVRICNVDNYSAEYGVYTIEGDNLYASSDEKLKIAEIRKSSFSDENYILYGGNTIQKLLESGIILPIYKHTFKMNSDGSYYWVSSELTNKNELKIV